MRFREKYIGDRAFYKHAMVIVFPMIVQNLITNLVSMLDNIMVGRVGTDQMNGVSIANQLMFVFNITIFGGLAGASIFGTQYFGKKDAEGQKYTFRFRLIMVMLLCAVGAVVFRLFDNELIGLFLGGDDDPEVVARTLQFGKQYLAVMLFGLVPFGLGQAYSSVVRECGETRIPMIASMMAIVVNLFLDYTLIFGTLGFPKLGVVGAAIATVVAKVIEAAVVIVWAHCNPAKNLYIVGLFRGFKIPWNLAKKIAIKSTPLLFNEFLWSLGMTVIAQCYSRRGLEVVAARNIASVLSNLFGVFFVQMGAGIGIIVGALLGAGEEEKARDTDNKLIMFSIVSTVVVAALMVPVSFVFPNIYKTTASIRSLATFYLLIQAVAMPMFSYTNACYFTLRSGGKTGITFLFDFVFTWVVQIPLAFILTKYTSMEIHLLLAVVTYAELIKVVVGYFMVRSDLWIVNMVGGDSGE